MASTPSQNKKSRLTNSDCEIMYHDIFSDLPGHVLDQILSRLPTKDVVRTSVVSTNWRYKWASVTSIAIDQRTGFTNSVIDEILMLHLGPVHKFKISCGKRKVPYEKVRKRILYLSRHPINELVLRLRDYVFRGHRTPSSLFYCRDLTHLDLYGFTLSLPSAFDGFKNLKSVTLDFVEMADQDVEALISRSPLLERVTLSGVYTLNHLNIHGPNLLYFYIKGHFVEICFITASRLTELYINVETRNFILEQRLSKGDELGDLTQLMAGIPQISRLTLRNSEDDFVIYLPVGIIPRALTVPYTNLVLLYIDVMFSEAQILLCLLRSAPNLEELQIGSHPEYFRMDFAIARAWDTNGLDSPFTRLRFVKIRNFMGTEYEMDFVKFVLLASPALECMTIELRKELSTERDSTSKFEIVTTMLSFNRASSQAKIKVCGKV